MKWQILPTALLSDDFINLVKKYTNLSDGHYLAQLLWQRNLRTEEQLKNFLSYQDYQPSSYLVFGTEILGAKDALENALIQGKNVAIWGNFEPDGLIATCVLWEGLGQYFHRNKQLFYYIPNRLREFYGLNTFGLDQLASQNVKLIIAFDTGITNTNEINYAHELGIDIIFVDHHILSENSPNIKAIINPLSLPKNYPLSYFSGVVVAYKLMECLANNWQKYKQFNPEELLDLVAIGLLSTLVELKEDYRYLAQIAIKQLQNTKRVGILKLLESCQEKGDRPTDISTGIGARINAVSHIYGNPNFCVEFLTGKEQTTCNKLVEQIELANIRSKSLQENVVREVKKKLKRVDLSTTNMIVLADNQWELGILALVAKKIAEEYGRPTILLNITEIDQIQIAQGYAYSTNQINLNNLLRSQSNLLMNFSGHPFTPRLTLLTDNIELFINNLNQKLRQKNINFSPKLDLDMIVTVADLSGELLKEVKYLEPFGIGNKAPKFLVKKCWFEQVKKEKIYDNNRCIYAKITFSLRDDSTKEGFWGVWWCNNNDTLAENKTFDIIIEKDIDFNKKQVQIRLIEINETNDHLQYQINNDDFLIDLRNNNNQEITSDMIVIEKTPLSWQELEKQAKIAKKSHKKLVLNYHYSPKSTPLEIWKQLLGIVKYLAKANIKINQDQLADKLGLDLITLQLGLVTLAKIGLVSEIEENELQFTQIKLEQFNFEKNLLQFLATIGEEQFNKQYFTQVSLEIIREMFKK